MLDLTRNPHRRYNPLTREWVLVSPHRTERPWQGQVEDTPPESLPHYDPQCYLCPGNARAGGVRNPNYDRTFVFENDFAALKLDTPKATLDNKQLIVAVGEPGSCRVICFSPRHDLTISKMQVPDLLSVVSTWVSQYRELGALSDINWVQIFENRGAIMGASNPHPHGQIWANYSLPDEAVKELRSLREYISTHDSCLLCDYLSLERGTDERLVYRNQDFTALVPFWAVWPFEILIVSEKHTTGIDHMSESESTNLADILQRLTIRYDQLFNVPFPYTMGFHQRPTDGQTHEESHLHLHFYPPLLRSATVRKFMVGYEMLAMPQRDITPEAAADRLRSLG
ncbi:MAG TPA: UDP-glucose--hexose-1-phosphate uridylyltransferase [Pyrinomonadaceae bacterium]|nr:UDP-glucose--hexose-1-phosphate uridylyltransferase [Pyrinomonadaceae bacterium]